MKFNVLYSLALVLLGLAIPHGAKAQNEAGFDCSKANGVIETQVCASPKLSQMDTGLTKLYKSARISLFGFDKSGEIPLQVQWVKNRDRMCKSDKKIEACLEGFYKTRIAELAVATLFKYPDASLKILDQYNHSEAPFYYALYYYVTEPKSPQRDNKIIALLKPAYDELATGNEYIKSTLDDVIGKNIEDGLKDDKNFGALWVFTKMGASSNLSDAGDVQAVPCAALLKKPGLLSAVDSYFGSTLDGQLPASDCGATLPTLPNYEKLQERAFKLQPQCDGTIRFGVWRQEDRDWDAISIGQFGDLLARADKKEDASAPDLIGKPLFNAAEAELSAYFDKYFGPGKIDKTKLDTALKAQLSQVEAGC